METLAERIAWILKNRTSPDGDPWEIKELSMAAGLSQSHVNQMLHGRVKQARGNTLAKLAAVAKVRMEWLVSGQGSPDPEATSTPATPSAVPGDLVVDRDDETELERAVVQRWARTNYPLRMIRYDLDKTGHEIDGCPRAGPDGGRRRRRPCPW